MLTKRIIPCLDVDKGRVVKGVNFVELRDAGDPVQQAKYYDEEGADELVFLDITASAEKRKTILAVMEKVAESVFLPLTVGGGIRTTQDIKDLLAAGADKVSINTAAVERPDFVREAADAFGSQCVVAAIDARRRLDPSGPYQLGAGDEDLRGFWEVYTYGGRRPTGLDAVSWARRVEELGAGEILLTSMDCDGTQKGYDIKLTREVASAVNVPVIASGGAGDVEDMYQVLAFGKADAVLAASIFHYRRVSIAEAKEYLASLGLPIRRGS